MGGDLAVGYAKALGHSRGEALDDAIGCNAEDAYVGAGHTDVGDVARAARKYLLVGGSNVRMRAENNGKGCAFGKCP